jgi:hypothetical protein
VKGLALGKLVKVDDSLYRVEFGSINNITIVTGITKLAYEVIFGFLSSYNALSKVGSFFPKLIGGNLFVQDKTDAILTVTNELLSFEKRFKAFQSSNSQNIPLDELLESFEVVDIDVIVEEQKVKVLMKILNKLGQLVHIEV